MKRKTLAFLAVFSLSTGCGRLSYDPPKKKKSPEPAPAPAPAPDPEPLPPPCNPMPSIPGLPHIPGMPPFPSMPVIPSIPSIPRRGNPCSIPVPEPTPGPAPAPVPPQDQATLTDLANIINQERAAKGLSVLTINTALNCATKRHAADAGSHSSCSHTGSDGSSPWDRAKDCGGSGNGEIIACGQGSPREAVDAWIASPGHNAIMFDGSNRTFGLGVSNNYWVVLFSH